MKWRNFFFPVFIILLLQSCSSCQTKEKVQQGPAAGKQHEAKIIEANKHFLLKERKEIEQYIERQQLNMQKTGTGLYYAIEHHSDMDHKPVTGDRVQIHYRCALLDGTLLYSSEEQGVKVFTVDKDYTERGLHEGIKLLNIGDKAKFILPSHLAFGVHGDQNKVASRTAIVYDVELITITTN